jgi:hypothetical protein
MDKWDVAGTDAAVTALARTLGPQEIFELFAWYGSRDFRDLGHKAIYVANSWRTLQNIGWQHAEPVLRSLAYALLEHKEGNPASSDAAPDRPGRRNQELIAKIRADWLTGKRDPGGSQEMIRTLRQGDASAAADQAVDLLNRGVSPDSVWEGVFQAAAELLMREPGIVALHSFTTSNAMHYAWQHCSQEQTRRWLLLQAASFLTLFRDQLHSEHKGTIDELKHLPGQSNGAAAVAEIFDQVGQDRHVAAQMALAYFTEGGPVNEFMHAARRLIYLKGTDSHDYKFSEAALEDCASLSAPARERYLASTLFYLRGSGGPDNKLVARTRDALRG